MSRSILQLSLLEAVLTFFFYTEMMLILILSSTSMLHSFISRISVKECIEDDLLEAEILPQ